MKALIIHGVVGVGLFAGALMGGLWFTGRLDHEGTANLPLLNLLFPAPEAGAGGKDETGKAEVHPAPAGETADAAHQGEPGKPQDAGHEAGAEGPQGPEAPRRSKIGKSVVEPEKPPASGGHGAPPAGEAEHGTEPKVEHGDPKGEATPGKPGAESGKPAGQNAAALDFTERERVLAEDKKNKYAPGGFFVFEGMPAGLTPEQINDAWQRVQGVLADLDRRKTVLDVREQDLQERLDDIARRQRDLGRERESLNLAGRELDAKIAKFQDQVKLVRNDEVAALRRNAETLANFERSKAAELVAEQWKTEKGQDEVLKTLEFMDKDAVNEIIEQLPKTTIEDVLKKRLRVSKEAVPPAGAKK